MFDILASITILGALYYFFIRGFIFRAALWIFGFIGLNDFLHTHIHALTHTVMTILDHPIPWSLLISFTISILAIITTKVKKENNV